MIKLAITGLIVYGIYKYLIVPSNTPIEETVSKKQNQKKNAKEEDDFIDYEEVD